MAHDRSNHPEFGPDYIPPAERIRRAQNAGHAPTNIPGPSATSEGPPNLRGGGASFVLGSLAVFAVVTVAVFFLVDGPARLAEMDDCQEFHDAIRYHLDVPETWSRPARTGEEAEGRARHTAEAYQGLADDLESFTLEDPDLDDLRIRFAQFSVDAQGVLHGYRCREKKGWFECEYWDYSAATQFDRGLTGFLAEYNTACTKYNVDFYPRINGSGREKWERP